MEQLKHECGVAMIRLLKPLDYYKKKYGTWMYGLNKLYLLMEKQHNRGQEGAGLACVKLDATPGYDYMFRERAQGSNAIAEIFQSVHANFKSLTPEALNDAVLASKSLPFAGQLYMGHLRYSTTGKSGIQYVHPFLRRNNWRAKNLCICGNFNMTNIDEIFKKITDQGQYPRDYSDSNTLLELMGHRLDREVERNYAAAQKQGLTGLDITNYIDDHVEMSNVLRTTMPDFDGGYVICAVTGSGEMCTMRDPWGIRPAFYYINDEVVVLASERPVIQTTFELEYEEIQELEPGTALFIKRNGQVNIERIMEQKGNNACSFERIYFSRGSDRDIYKERKLLGEELVPTILDAVNHDIDHTVISFIPNTAEVAFYGMMEGFEKELNREKICQIEALGHNPSHLELDRILSRCVRSEKVAIKDIKLRTFITEGNSRNDLAAHVYDITYGSLKPGVDNLVVIDDSIVRGTTLKESIIKILDRLHPRKIVIVSSSPQIRYPDYYGIDMAHLEEFIAFRACIELLKERHMQDLIEETYNRCKAELKKPKEEMENCVKALYKPFSAQELNQMMVKLLRPKGVTTPIELVYQSIEGLHRAIPNHHGDWYFTGDYPTPGGVKLVNEVFVNYIEKVYNKDIKILF